MKFEIYHDFRSVENAEKWPEVKDSCESRSITTLITQPDCRVLLWADSAAGLGPAWTRIRVNVNAASLQSMHKHWQGSGWTAATPKPSHSGARLVGHSEERGPTADVARGPLEQVLRGFQALGWTGLADGCIWRVHSHAQLQNNIMPIFTPSSMSGLWLMSMSCWPAKLPCEKIDFS